MRISDWSSDVCSSDLVARDHPDTVAVLLAELQETGLAAVVSYGGWADDPPVRVLHDMLERGRADEPVGSSQEEGRTQDRTSVVEGKSGSVRVDIGGRRIIKKKIEKTQEKTRDT